MALTYNRAAAADRNFLTLLSRAVESRTIAPSHCVGSIITSGTPRRFLPQEFEVLPVLNASGGPLQAHTRIFY